MRGKESLEEKAARSIIKNYSEEQLKELKRTLPDYIYASIGKVFNKQKFKDVTGLIKFHQEIKDFLLSENFWENIEFYIGNFTYYLDTHFERFFPEDIERSPYEEIPLNKFYLFDNIGELLYRTNKSLLRKTLIYYPEVGNKNPELFNYAYKFGKRKKKKKLSSDIKKKCKKKGIRLTYTRNGKRVYKSEKVLRKQLANRT